MKPRCAADGVLFCVAMLVACVLFSLSVARSAAESEGDAYRADAVVIVNSASASFFDFQRYTQPYLDHFGIPYTVLDIRFSPVSAAIGNYALIIIAHRQLDPADAYLDVAEEGFLARAVNSGTGLVNFDNDLSANGTSSRYQFITDVFGFGYSGTTSGSGINFPWMYRYSTGR